MRRAIAIALSLGAACLLLYGCSSDNNPTDLGIADIGDSPDKRPPNIYDPPPGFDPFYASLAVAIQSVEWDTASVIVDLTGGTTVVELPGYDPIEVVVPTNPMPMPPDGSDLTWECLMLVPEVPADGTINLPGGAIVFKLLNEPPVLAGPVEVVLPNLSCYDLEGYTGTFDNFDLKFDGTYWVAQDFETVVMPKWPAGEAEPEVFFEVQGSWFQDDPAPTLAQVLVPETDGDDP